MKKINKVCKTCNISKSIDDYYSQKRKDSVGNLKIYYFNECKECTKTRVRQNQLKDHSKYKENLKQYFIKHSKEHSARRKDWRQKNKDHIKRYFGEYQQSKKGKALYKRYGIERKSRNHTINNEEWNSCKTYFNNSCAYCGLTEQNHREMHQQDLHKEHVIHRGLNDLSNCVPACKNCNSSKWTFEFKEWYTTENPNYSASRKVKILSWINYAHKERILNRKGR
ncbi:HNH endonuclease [Bacillus sp. SIMBA_154]|uniref:HNH endonuclease n=1 Tax=Bacillus sp. SIMBA_154 TaxID=3080859 RepID=UPI00397E4D30